MIAGDVLSLAGRRERRPKPAHLTAVRRHRRQEPIMEPGLVLLTSTVLLAIAAAGGLLRAGMRFVGDRSPPAALAMLHGFLAAAAVSLLLYAAATVGLPRLALFALVLFLAAAAGGAILNLNYHWKQLPLPKGLVVAHAAIAVLGFVLLVTATWAVRAR
ncbi:MAG TPA: hypothetical protein VMT14_17785 [Burkholderiaceae bacterium]|nr:hypothetical protein [Burkholderiaceae bacterium]